MKLTKYTFRTPLFGSIQAEELLSDTDGRIELSPEQMCVVYDQGSDLMMFLSENWEDLAYCVPEELRHVVLRAEFGDCAMIGGRMYLRTYIWTEEEVDETAILQIIDWIAGQMSDGWGEGLEQRAWKDERVHKPVMYFDEDSCEFEEDYEDCWASYYVHPWNFDDFNIYLEEVEDVEEELEIKVVATIDLPYHSREVVKLSSSLALRMFLKDSGRPDLVEQIEDSCIMQDRSFYLVRKIEGESGVEILPKWACENGSFCSLYDMSSEETVGGTQMPVSKAVLELLK